MKLMKAPELNYKDKLMKLSDKILVIAAWLEDANNELLSEVGDEHLDSLALSFVAAAETLKEAAEEIKEIEPAKQTEITSTKLEEMAAVAEAFDASGDEMLVRQASVLDELLQTLAAPKNYIFNFKKAEEDKLDAIKKNYKSPKEELDKNIGAKEAVEAVKDSTVYKERTKSRLEFPLSSRMCPEHSAPLFRVGENEFQCSLDKKLYNFDTGYTLLDGTKVQGGSVASQTDMDPNNNVLFDSRDERLGQYRG